MYKTWIALAGAGVLAAGCATSDPYGYNSGMSSNTATKAATGAALGAVAGAVIGNNVGSGDAGTGAALGAVVGGVAGAVAGCRQDGGCGATMIRRPAVTIGKTGLPATRRRVA